jgi:hypothetical protein
MERRAIWLSPSEICLFLRTRTALPSGTTNGFTLWHYKSGKDKLDSVSSGNYLADASDMLTAGDLLMVTAADGARILCVTLADIETVITAPLS